MVLPVRPVAGSRVRRLHRTRPWRGYTLRDPIPVVRTPVPETCTWPARSQGPSGEAAVASPTCRGSRIRLSSSICAPPE